MLTAKQFLVFTVGTLVLNSPLYAEVVTDGTIGLGKTLEGPHYTIDESLGKIQGSNWFHSFREFNIGTGESATFSPEPVTNIIARVTGGNRSSIYGSLSASTNLYLLNPSGILFGQGASVNVDGSFHASTADYIRLPGGTVFPARPNLDTGLLKIAPTEAFGFLSNRPATIEVKEGSVLNVSEGKDLSLIGGDLTIQDSSLQASGGRINLASVASKGEVVPTSSNWVKNFEQLGKITLSQSPWLPEENPPPANLEVSASVAGQISIRAGELFSSNASVFADTSTGNKGGLIDISVEGPISLTHNTLITANNSTQTSPDSQQQSGIVINAKGPLFLGLTQEDLNDPVFADSLKVLKNAHTPKEVQEIAGGFFQNGVVFSRIGILNDSCVIPDCKSRSVGNISITTPVLEISYGAIEYASIDSSNAGNIQINASQVNLHDYGYINASIGSSSSGDAGNILLRDGVNPSSKISLSNYSTISASTEENSHGNAGNVDLKTQELVLQHRGQINSFSRGNGDAGLINIEADTALLTDDSGIYTKADLASGGNINFHVHDWLVLFNSKITAEAWGEEGNGGNLTIDNFDNKSKILALSRSELLATAKQGHGGNIKVFAKHSLGWIKFNQGREFNQDSYYSVVDASSGKGDEYHGRIDFNAQQWEFPGLRPLSRDFVEDNLSLNRCAYPNRSREQSYFIITARDILPRSPEDLRTHTIRVGK